MIHVPEGFQPHTRKSGFTAPWEPIYHRPHDNGISLGLHARDAHANSCLLYTSPSPRDLSTSRMPSSA